MSSVIRIRNIAKSSRHFFFPLRILIQKKYARFVPESQSQIPTRGGRGLAEKSTIIPGRNGFGMLGKGARLDAKHKEFQEEASRPAGLFGPRLLGNPFQWRWILGTPKKVLFD
jgi:hypothetical protein